MWLFRQINRLIRSGAYVARDMTNLKTKQVKSQIRLATSLTIFATSVIGLGANLTKRASRAVARGGRGGKGKKQKSNYQEPKESFLSKRHRKKLEASERKAIENRKKADAYDAEIARIQEEESIDVALQQKLEAQREYEKNFVKPRAYNNPLNIPDAFYDVKILIEDKHEELLDNTLDNPVYYNGSGLVIKLNKTMSKEIYNNLYKPLLNSSISNDEAEPLFQKYKSDLEQGQNEPKMKEIIILPREFLNEKGDDYLLLSSPSKLLSKASIDYGKIYIPLFLDLLDWKDIIAERSYF